MSVLFQSDNLPWYWKVLAHFHSGPVFLHWWGFEITLRHSTLGRTPLDEWSARRRDLPDNTQHSQETFMSPAGSEPTIPAIEWPHAHALDRAVAGIGSLPSCNLNIRKFKYMVFIILRFVLHVIRVAYHLRNTLRVCRTRNWRKYMKAREEAPDDKRWDINP